MLRKLPVPGTAVALKTIIVFILLLNALPIRLSLPPPFHGSKIELADGHFFK